MFLENLKANLLILLFFSSIGGISYWAISTLQVSPDKFDKREVDARPVVTTQPTVFDGSMTQTNVADSPVSVPAPIPVPASLPAQVSTTSTGGQNSTLKSELERLISDNIIMKRGSRGTRVGTIQRFLNLYNGTSSTVDNDFGPGTENRLRDFQRSEGLTADGQSGPATYRKMIEWLDKQ